MLDIDSGLGPVVPLLHRFRNGFVSILHWSCSCSKWLINQIREKMYSVALSCNISISTEILHLACDETFNVCNFLENAVCNAMFVIMQSKVQWQLTTFDLNMYYVLSVRLNFLKGHAQVRIYVSNKTIKMKHRLHFI